MSLGQILDEYSVIEQGLYVLGIILIAYLSYFLTRKFILRGITKLIHRSSTKFDDLVVNDKLLKRLAIIIPVVVVYNLIDFIPDIPSTLSDFINNQLFPAIYIFILMLIIASFLSSLNRMYTHSQIGKRKPIKGYIQVLTIVLYIVGTIIIISYMFKRDPTVLLGGLGALTAVLLLVFRDTILSFVASLQISSNDLVQIGDWIEIGAHR